MDHVWQQYENFGIDNLDFADTPMHLLYLGIKKYIISMIPTLLKQRLRQNPTILKVGRAERMLLTGAMTTNTPTKMNLLVPKAGNHLTIRHSKKVSLSIYSNFDSTLNGDQLKCNSYKSFKYFQFYGIA